MSLVPFVAPVERAVDLFIHWLVTREPGMEWSVSSGKYTAEKHPFGVRYAATSGAYVDFRFDRRGNPLAEPIMLGVQRRIGGRRAYEPRHLVLRFDR